MVTYVLLFTMLQSGQLKKLFDWIAYTVQIVSFSSAIFAFGLLISRVLILFKIGEQSYYYGVMNGRLWGLSIQMLVRYFHTLALFWPCI